LLETSRRGGRRDWAAGVNAERWDWTLAEEVKRCLLETVRDGREVEGCMTGREIDGQSYGKWKVKDVIVMRPTDRAKARRMLFYALTFIIVTTSSSLIASRISILSNKNSCRTQYIERDLGGPNVWVRKFVKSRLSWPTYRHESSERACLRGGFTNEGLPLRGPGPYNAGKRRNLPT
jgi:hypothetical protein